MKKADYSKLPPAFVERMEKVRELTPDVVEVPEIKNVVKALNELYDCEKKGTQEVVTHLVKVADYITSLQKSVNDATVTEQTGMSDNIGALQQTVSEEFAKLLTLVIQLPTRLPEPKEPIDTRDEIKAVESAVKALELNPNIVVPKPEVITDHKDVIAELKKTTKAINSINIPEVNIPEADYTEITERLDTHSGYLQELVKQSQIRTTPGSSGGGSGAAAEPTVFTNDGTFASETGNLASIAQGQNNGTQVTKLLANGNEVDSVHPLPISGSFADSNGVPYSTSNRLPVEVGDLSVQNLNVSFPPSVISTVNTTMDPLAANATFTGQWEDVTQYAAITCAILADQPSAVNGAIVQFSADGISVLKQTAVTIPANTGLSFSFAPEAQYFRVIYTNGATTQTQLETQTLYSYQTPAATQIPLATQTTDIFRGAVTAAHLKGRHSSGAWIPVATSATGKLGVDLIQPTTPTDTQPVKDDFQAGEILADQTGAGGVITFSFTNPVNLVWITEVGSDTAAVCRADPFGGTPTSSLGIPIGNNTPTPITVVTSSVKVYAPSGAIVSVYGYRRT